MNVYSLYKRMCDGCGKKVVSIYHEDLPFKIYCSSCWWGDSWDGTEYGQEYDPNKSFFEQVLELRNRTPFMALETQATTHVNTEYTNYSSNNKDSYLTYFADYLDNCIYVSFAKNVKDSADCLRISDSEECYGSVGVLKCYRTYFSEECDNCVNVYFSKNCSGCSDCFGCVNLRKKSNCIFNKHYTKEEYQKRLAELRIGSFRAMEKYQKEIPSFWRKYPSKFYHGNALNMNVSGDYISQSKNTRNAYLVTHVEDSRFVQMLSVPKTRDSYDYTGWGANSELLYECQSVGENASRVKFSLHCYPNVTDCEYSYYAVSSKNVFGCVNLKKKEYCILNKQYTKEEFDELKARIIEDMNKRPFIDSLGRIWSYGEFFPPILSPFGYNETLAMDYFPMAEDRVVDEGFAWKEKESQYTATINGSVFPMTYRRQGWMS